MRKKLRDSRVVWVGEVPVGGDHPIVVQSMTTTDTRNVEATVKQIISLQEAGCELIRVAVLDREAAQALASIKARIKIPTIRNRCCPTRLPAVILRRNPPTLYKRFNMASNTRWLRR
jgi:hypothetical protein